MIPDMEQEVDTSSSCAIQHGQLSDRVDDAQQQPQSIAPSAAAELSTVTTPIWPLSQPPSGYTTPAVAVMSLAAEAQAQTQPSGSQITHPSPDRYAATPSYAGHSQSDWATYTGVSLAQSLTISSTAVSQSTLQVLPNELLLDILGHLDVCDLLATSRVNHLLRSLSLAPILHQYRLQRTRLVLPPLLSPTNRPSLSDLVTRSIFLTSTSVVSRKLARSLVSIRLSRRLAARPSPEALVQRCVLPPECVPGMTGVHVMPALVAKRKAIEKERVKDGLRRWIAAKWRGEVYVRQEHARHWDELRGVGRVWRLTRFWERIGRGENLDIR